MSVFCRISCFTLAILLKEQLVCVDSTLRVFRIMLFSLSAGKFGGILAAIPQPIVAAILSITFGMVGEYYKKFQKSSERLFSEHTFILYA